VSAGGAGCNGTKRLEKEDASAQGVLVISTARIIMKGMFDGNKICMFQAAVVLQDYSSF
jgi:hypothetical protein